MYDLDLTIRERRSVRGFYPDRLVPKPLLTEALELAQRAPSNCNVQPWRVFVASGPRCERLRRALVSAIESGDMGDPQDPVDTFPGDYRRLQVECAVTMFREMGIERGDQPGRAKAMLRNFEFFDAPHVAIVTMEQHYGLGVALDVGMYVQTLMLALWARGVSSCPQASLRQYHHIIRRELGIRDDLRILCGVSFGYEDASVPANRTRQTREPLETNVVLLEE
ncbi:MAG: nitroreductase family protein [Pirellulales bacterium]|nr:nitroreductase family protein [Pirellulales bacterium]